MIYYIQSTIEMQMRLLFCDFVSHQGSLQTIQSIMKKSPNLNQQQPSSNYLMEDSALKNSSLVKAKNFLVVAQPPSPEDISIQQDKLSIDELRQKYPQTKKLTEDYVELPKINFLSAAIRQKQRKYSDVNIALPQFNDSDDRPASKTKGVPTQHRDSDNQYDQMEEESNYSRGWNINNIKLIPSQQNNYLESDFALLPEGKQEKKKRERKKSRDLERQRQRLLRERNMQMVSNFLSGKASVIWLFILGPEVPAQQIAEVTQIYKKYIQSDYQVPICRSYLQAIKFLNLQNCFFKIVVDINTSQQLLEESEVNKNITSIYLYNPKKTDGINKAFEIKRQTRKIKGIFNTLGQAAKQAHQEIENQTKFIKVGDQLESQKPKLRFPGFVSLSQADKTQISNYRLCLYGALKLKETAQRQEYLKEFTQMVQLRYKDSQKQLKNLQEYKKIDHIGENTQKKLQDILKFYVKQTFYYVLTNSILRLSRSAEQFRPCTIPFNQTYHAIKHFYQKYRKEMKNSQRKLTVYRGAKFRTSDINSLQVGGYIQLLGFTSTSISRAQAQKFMDGDSFLLEISIENLSQNQKEALYDHGFVEINRYNLAADAFQKEQEVLINALNVFQVTGIDLTSAVRKISLTYGAIFPLLRKKTQKLSPAEQGIVRNYLYCIDTFDQIQDDGDVLLLAQQHDRCVAYYQSKVDQGESDFKIHGKLANAQFESGDLQQAYSNALKSLQKLEYNSRNNIQIKKTVHQLQKNGNVFNESEDYIHYEKCIDACLKIIKEDWFQLPKLFKQKAESKFKIGDLAGSENDLQNARQIIQEREKSFDLRRRQIHKRYYMKSLCCMCSRSATTQLQQQKELQLLQVEQEQLQFQRRKDQIHQISIQILNIKKQIAELQGDNKKYDESMAKAEEHFIQIKKVQTQNPILKAKYQAIEASVMDKYKNPSDYESSMEKAISIVKKHDPFHKDIGLYAKVLGTQRQSLIKRKLQLPPINIPLNSSGNHTEVINDISARDNQSRNIIHKDKYDYEQHFERRTKCKQALNTAAENILYNEGKESSNYLTVVNKMIQVDLDYSMLRQSQRSAMQIKDFKLVKFHSEGARCYLLLSKICLAKGQLKNAFKNIGESFQILRTSLLKIDNKQYNAVFINHPLYYEINICKVKIFNRQLKHDLALKELSLLKKIVEKQVEKNRLTSILASVYEEQAQIQLCTGNTDEFQDMLQECIKLRQTQLGKYNIPNAITYQNLFKFLHNLQDYKTALEYHLKSTQIFSRFPPDHPNSWVVHLSNGLIFYQQKQFPKSIQQFEYCLKIAGQRYNLSHIVLIKINFQFAKLLKAMQKPKIGLEILNLLQNHLSKSLYQKESAGDRLLKQTDDEKYTLLKNIYNQMKEIFRVMNQQDGQSNLNSLMQIEKCDKKLKQMQLLILPSKQIISENRLA